MLYRDDRTHLEFKISRSWRKYWSSATEKSWLSNWIQSSELSYLLCNIFGHVTVSRIGLFPLESVSECSVPLPVLLEWTRIPFKVCFFSVMYQICSTKCSLMQLFCYPLGKRLHCRWGMLQLDCFRRHFFHRFARETLHAHLHPATYCALI